MREVVLLGVGMHKFGRWPDKSVEDLGQEAILRALEDAGIEFKDIEAAYCGRVLGNIGSGLRVVSRVGMTGIPITNVEAGCSAGTRAAMAACDAIAAGRYDVCLAVGFEKMGKGLLPMEGAEPTYEDLMGFAVNPALYALHIRRHMDKYGTTREHIAKASVIGHRNAALNPYAQHQQAMTLEQVLNSTMICDPITLYMCSPTSDGASACILCSREKANKLNGRPIRVSGWAGGSPKYSGETGPVLGNDDETHARVAKAAYEMAGIGPDDVDVCQLHDAFASAAIYEVENLGFCPKGEGGPFLWEGNTEITGKIPTNTDGGLVGRGHPLGATGIAQMAEIAWQLRGEAGKRQVAGNPRVGLAHNAGLGGVSVMVLHT